MPATLRLVTASVALPQGCFVAARAAKRWLALPCCRYQFRFAEKDQAVAREAVQRSFDKGRADAFRYANGKAVCLLFRVREGGIDNAAGIPPAEQVGVDFFQ